MSIRLVYRKARSARSKKAGTYYIEGRYRGVRIHESLGTSERARANELFAKRLAAITETSELGAKAVANFAAAVVAYYDELRREGREENSNTPWLDEMLPIIGERRLCDFTQADLDALADTMRPKASPQTRKRQVYTPFISAYNAAADRDPPLAEARRWKSPQPKRKPAKAPDDDYVSKLVDAADISEVRATKTKSGKVGGTRTGSRKPLRDKAVVLFITFTGFRTGEAQRLRLRDLDLARGTAEIGRTKNGEPRKVALAPELLDALRAQVADMATRGIADPDALVFEVDTRWGIPQILKRARRRAKLPDYRPHQIGRHAFATRLLNAGESTAAVKQAGGWKSDRAFDEFYKHLASERVDQAVSGARLQRKTVTQNDTQPQSTSEKSNKSAA